MAMTLTKEQRQEILSVWGIGLLPKDKQIIALYEKVRDIPFGNIGSRDPYTVFQMNKGTCSGKNFLIKELYNEIGVKTKDMICLQRWKDLTWYPDDEYDIWGVEFTQAKKKVYPIKTYKEFEDSAAARPEHQFNKNFS